MTDTNFRRVVVDEDGSCVRFAFPYTPIVTHFGKMVCEAWGRVLADVGVKETKREEIVIASECSLEAAHRRIIKLDRKAFDLEQAKLLRTALDIVIADAEAEHPGETAWWSQQEAIEDRASV